jgi:hypothetical protein
VNRFTEFESQYAKYTHYSTAIHAITTPDEAIFLDMWDDIIYWEAKRTSTYPYSIFIPMAATHSQYTAARTNMFSTNPPIVYYSCPALATTYNALPSYVSINYVQLLADGKPSCLYIHNNKVHNMQEQQWQTLARLGFSLPNKVHE